MAGDARFGKTTGGAAELAFHLTGDYPEWWNGKCFDRPVRAWAAGVTGETTRDVLQEKLIGPPFRESEWGTGMIPKARPSSPGLVLRRLRQRRHPLGTSFQIGAKHGHLCYCSKE
jgi:hypothetical protein